MSYKVKGNLSVSRRTELANIPSPPNSIGVDGALVFDDATNAVNIFHSGVWNPLGLTGCAGLDACSVTSLVDVSDDATPPQIGDRLTWDGTNWVPAPCGTGAVADDWIYRYSASVDSDTGLSIHGYPAAAWVSQPDDLEPAYNSMRGLQVDRDRGIFFSWTNGGAGDYLTFVVKALDGDFIGQALLDIDYIATENDVTDAFAKHAYDPVNQVIWFLLKNGAGLNNNFLFSVDVSDAKLANWTQPPAAPYVLNAGGAASNFDSSPGTYGDTTYHNTLTYSGSVLADSKFGSIWSLFFDPRVDKLYFGGIRDFSDEALAFVEIYNNGHGSGGGQAEVLNDLDSSPEILLQPNANIANATTVRNMYLSGEYLITQDSIARFGYGSTWDEMVVANRDPDTVSPTPGEHGFYAEVEYCGPLQSASDQWTFLKSVALEFIDPQDVRMRHLELGDGSWTEITDTATFPIAAFPNGYRHDHIYGNEDGTALFAVFTTQGPQIQENYIDWIDFDTGKILGRARMGINMDGLSRDYGWAYDSHRDVLWLFDDLASGAGILKLHSIDVSNRANWGIDGLYSLNPLNTVSEGTTSEEVTNHGRLLDGDLEIINQTVQTDGQNKVGYKGALVYDPGSDTLYYANNARGDNPTAGNLQHYAWNFYAITHDEHGGTPFQPSMPNGNLDSPDIQIDNVSDSVYRPGGTVSIVISHGNMIFVRNTSAGNKPVNVSLFANGETAVDVNGGLTGTPALVEPDVATNWDHTQSAQQGYWGEVLRPGQVLDRPYPPPCTEACGGIYAGSGFLEDADTVVNIPAGESLQFTNNTGDTLLGLDSDSGKVTIPNEIDPTGLALTPVAANPGGSLSATTIWVDEADSKPYQDITKLESAFGYVGGKFRFIHGLPPLFLDQAAAAVGGLTFGQLFRNNDGYVEMKL